MTPITKNSDAIGSEVQGITDKDIANTVAGIIIALGMIGGGTYLTINMLANISNRSSVAYRSGSFDWLIFSMFTGLGVLLFCLGAFLGRFMLSHLRTSTSIGENGMLVRVGNKEKVLLWDQIVKLIEVHLLPQKSGKGLAATAIHAMDHVVVSYELIRSDNEVFRLSEKEMEKVKEYVPGDVQRTVEKR